jgi:hypothetical protein
MKIKTTRIDWDTSFGEVGYPNRLPQQVIVEIDEPLELGQDKIADKLSDTYGWCIHGLDYEIMSL